jgi:hypothetical protein
MVNMNFKRKKRKKKKKKESIIGDNSSRNNQHAPSFEEKDITGYNDMVKGSFSLTESAAHG